MCLRRRWSLYSWTRGKRVMVRVMAPIVRLSRSPWPWWSTSNASRARSGQRPQPTRSPRSCHQVWPADHPLPRHSVCVFSISESPVLSRPWEDTFSEVLFGSRRGLAEGSKPWGRYKRLQKSNSTLLTSFVSLSGWFFTIWLVLIYSPIILSRRQHGPEGRHFCPSWNCSSSARLLRTPW